MSFRALLWKDATRAWRGRDGLLAGVVLAFLFLLLDLFAIVQLGRSPGFAAIVLWTPIVFAGGAVAGRAFVSEAERGLLPWLRSLPVEPALHGISQTVIQAGTILTVTLASTAAAAALFAIPVDLDVVGVLTMGAIGVAIVGTLVAGIAAQARTRELLLPVLLVPAIAPLLQAGVQATIEAIEGTPSATALWLMAGFDVTAAGIAWLLWPAILEADA